MEEINHRRKNDEIIEIKYDFSKNYMLYLMKVDYRNNDDEALFKIVDMETNEAIFQMIIKDKRFLGWFRSEQGVIIDGHIYFSNIVIKLRYDIIEKNEHASYSHE